MAGIFGSYILFSPVSGTIVKDGKPCIGATLEQRVRSPYGEDKSIRATTDADGKFSFEEITESKGLFSFLPSEFVASQQITIVYDGDEYLGWAHSKRSDKRFSESDGKPFTLQCDLGKPPEEADKYSGICRLVDE